MAKINDCELPDSLYYMVEDNVWVSPLNSRGYVRVGLTPVAFEKAGGGFTSAKPDKEQQGLIVHKGESLVHLENPKYSYTLVAPVTGWLVEYNKSAMEDPEVIDDDAYEEGWILEIKPTQWDSEKNSLMSGKHGMEQYRQYILDQDICCK